MSDVLSIASLAISAAALYIAFRSERRSHLDRSARPRLGIEITPSSTKTDDHGVIQTSATTVFVTLAIKITNEGSKAADRTQVEAWAPSHVDFRTWGWVDLAGAAGSARSVADPHTTLPTGDGRSFDTRRISHT